MMPCRQPICDSALFSGIGVQPRVDCLNDCQLGFIDGACSGPDRSCCIVVGELGVRVQSFYFVLCLPARDLICGRCLLLLQPLLRFCLSGFNLRVVLLGLRL